QRHPPAEPRTRQVSRCAAVALEHGLPEVLREIGCAVPRLPAAAQHVEVALEARIGGDDDVESLGELTEHLRRPDHHVRIVEEDQAFRTCRGGHDHLPLPYYPND